MAEKKQALGVKASNNARSRLIKAHEDEFRKFIGEEREKLGLPREMSSKKVSTKQKVERRITDLQTLLQEMPTEERAEYIARLLGPSE